MQVYQGGHLGTLLSIQVDTPHNMWGVFLEITKRVTDFEERFSRFRENNWLSTLNTQKYASLDDDAHTVISYALKVAKQSEWVFDPTILPRLESIGYTTSSSHEQRVWYQWVHLSNDSITLDPGVRIELGGIGKWYLIDEIMAILDRHHHTRFLIDFGGDIFARGIWQVGLENPLNPEYILQEITLTDEAIAGSSGEKRKIWDQGHIIHPLKIDQTPTHMGVFVRADTAMHADVHATLFYLFAQDETKRYLGQYEEGIREVYVF